MRSDVGLITSDRLGAGTRDKDKYRDRDGQDWTVAGAEAESGRG